MFSRLILLFYVKNQSCYLAWRIRHKSKYILVLNKGMKEKISYERHDYETVADAPQSKAI